MKPRYMTPVTRAFAAHYLRAYFGSVRLPAGASYLWIAGVQWVTDQPGVYLWAASGGLEGVQVLPAAVIVRETMEAAG